MVRAPAESWQLALVRHRHAGWIFSFGLAVRSGGEDPFPKGSWVRRSGRDYGDARLLWTTIAFWIYYYGKWPLLEEFFAGRNWFLSLGIFAAFRFFDVAKPWPVKQSQTLPGGWGITVDDFLAAIYVSAVAGLGWCVKALLLARQVP